MSDNYPDWIEEGDGDRIEEVAFQAAHANVADADLDAFCESKGLPKILVGEVREILTQFRAATR